MLEKEQIGVGSKHTIQKRVSIEDTSLNYGSGKIENLLATPRVAALAIEAAAQMVDPHLAEGFVSVCQHISIDHFKATCLGAVVTVEVEVESIAVDRVDFKIHVYDDHGSVAKGREVRRIVNQQKLMEVATVRDMSPEQDE